MYYRIKQNRISSISSVWPEYPELRQEDLCRRVFEQGFSFRPRDNRNPLLEYLRGNVPFQGYRKGVLPPLGRVMQIIDVAAMLLNNDGVAKVLLDTWPAARPDLAEAVRAYCTAHAIAPKSAIEGNDSHRWMDATLAAHAAAVLERAGASFDVLECRLMLCVWTGCRRVDSREGEVTIQPPEAAGADLSDTAPVARPPASTARTPVESPIAPAGVSSDVTPEIGSAESIVRRGSVADVDDVDGPEAAADVGVVTDSFVMDDSSEPATESAAVPEPVPEPELERAPEPDFTPEAVPLRRALQRHDEALRRVRSEATTFRQLVDDELVAAMSEAAARLQDGVRDVTDALRELVAAVAHECDAVAAQIDAVPAPSDRERMRQSLTRVRGAFEQNRSERQRGLRLLDELRGEVLSYARRRAELVARIAEATLMRDDLLHEGIEFGAAMVLSEADELPALTDEESTQSLEAHLAAVRAANLKLSALLQEQVRRLVQTRRQECAARLAQVEAAAAQGVAAATPLVRRLQRAIEQIDGSPRHDELRTLLRDSAALVADADQLADELGVERAARRVLQDPDWAGIRALIGSLWLKREFGPAFVVLASALRAGHLPSTPLTTERVTQSHLRDALAFLGGDSAVVIANLLLDPYWPELLARLPAEDNAVYFLLLTAFVAAGDGRFHAGKLWQPSMAAEAVMIEHMPRWHALSERLMHGDAWQIARAANDFRSQLVEAEQSLRAEFARRSDGRYARVSADGIANMLQVEQQKLLPDLEKRIDVLFNVAPGSEAWVRVLEELDVDVETTFDRYFGALNESRHSHMRRNLLHRLTGFRDKVQQYAALRIAQQDYERRRPFLLADLQKELDDAAELLGADVRALAHTLLTRIGARRSAGQDAQDVAESDYFGARIRAAMFERAEVVRRMPRTAELVFSADDDARLGWDALLESIALDLSEPLTPAEMLPRFVEAGFYFGAETIAAEIDEPALQELQRERRQLEAQIDALMLRLHTQTDAQRANRRKGRLRSLLVQLQQEIAVQEEIEREADAARRRSLSVRLAKLKEDVRMLEDDIEQRNENAELTPQAVGELMRGLAAVREVQMRRLEHGVDTVGRILEEMYHFLNFDGTSLGKVTQAIDRHFDELAVVAEAGAPRTVASGRGIERAAWLEELLSAGLTESQLAVRREAWEQWQRMTRMQNRFDDGGVAGEEATILESFARRLAEATRLMYSKSGHDTLFALRPLAWFETKFQQPRDALRRYKVRFLFVTGQVAKRDLRILEDHVRSQNFLEDEWLNVFVAPNSDSAEMLQRWLQQNRIFDTCSVLDEATVQDILKCRQNPTAAGRMCRFLLRAVDPGHLEVFRFQNVVDAERDIFKGRAHEIKQIESGRGSFYIFGGRRIGKTSLLFAAEKHLRKAGAVTAYVSFEGHTDAQGLTVVRDVLRKLGVRQECPSLDAFRELFTEFVLRVTAEKAEKNERREVVVFFDEVDRYITGCRAAGVRSHPLIHVLRALHQELHGRARFVMAGAIELWRQLKGRSDIPGAETPWANFATPIALGALNATDARAVVTTGFGEVLGIGLEDGVDRQIVENTTGHPAFVQFYCARLHHRLHQRIFDTVSMEDVTAVFKDRRDDNFVTYARDTLSLNLADLTRLGVYLLAIERCDRFNAGDLARLAPGYQLPADLPWAECLDELQMTGVVRSEGGMYRFSVPTYPELLRQMEATLQDDVAHLIEKTNVMYAAERAGAEGRER
jgi:hypothetical protein